MRSEKNGMWLSSCSNSSGVKKRLPKGATPEFPFSAPTRNFCRVSVIRGIVPRIMTICPLWGCLPEIIVTVKDIRVVNGHHFGAANFDGQLLHDGAAQVLNHSPVNIAAFQCDREVQPRGPGYNHVMHANVGEADKQLLVLVDAARMLGLLVMTTDCRTVR